MHKDVLACGGLPIGGTHWRPRRQGGPQRGAIEGVTRVASFSKIGHLGVEHAPPDTIRDGRRADGVALVCRQSSED